MNTSLILASYVFKAQARSHRSSAPSIDPKARSTLRVIPRLLGGATVTAASR